MFTHKHYVPILKGKAGEFGALTELNDTNKQYLTPLLEIPPIPIKILKDKTKRRKTIEEHLGEFIPKLTKKWNNSNNEIFLDTHYVNDTSILNGKHFLQEIYRQAEEYGLILVPVIKIENNNTGYLNEIKKIVHEYKKGVCLRLDSVIVFHPQLKEKLAGCIIELGLQPKDVDIVIDYKFVLKDQETIITNSAMQAIKGLPSLKDWRTVTFSCTSFPIDMSGAKKDDITTIKRVEWDIWKNLVAREKEIGRIPTYGDYAIANPEMIDYDPMKMQMSASIRYTSDDYWLIVKGRSTKKIESVKQYIALCQKLIKQSEYCGKDFSWGDDYIYQCANKKLDIDELSNSNKKVTAGNPMIWRKVGTNHHLTFVTNQIANLVGI